MDQETIDRIEAQIGTELRTAPTLRDLLTKISTLCLACYEMDRPKWKEGWPTGEGLWIVRFGDNTTLGIDVKVLGQSFMIEADGSEYIVAEVKELEEYWTWDGVKHYGPIGGCDESTL